ncbi:hypothetical protein MNBD_NITROSPIRAE03-429 [hydrothermal vent metagenome]|uniref:CDP-glycerol:poly(Glycerophosphate) glycerophosphotransferase n=1 Tax=hydrothermal vent metagenome TaxID=652676 RepID=A0A3B1CTL5_9ZZZZ
MFKLNRLKAKFRDEMFFNPAVRRISNTVYRGLLGKEGKNVKEYCELNSRKSLVAFPVFQLYTLEHIRDLVDALKSNERMHPMLFTTTKKIPMTRNKKKEIFKFLSSRYNIVYNKNIFAYPWLKYSNVKMFFELSLTSYGCEVKCPRVLYTHGMAGLNFSKDFKHIKFVSRYNAIFLNGPLHKKALLTARKYHGADLPPMYEVGYLRGDRLLKMSKTFNRKAFLESLGLPDVPTVMYAPTWGDFSSTTGWIDKVVEVCGDMGINLLLRLHPIVLTLKAKWKTGGVDWNRKLYNIEKEHPHVRIAMSHDIDDIMLASDAMITDVSGMALEFLTMDKPVVFLPAPRYFEIYGSERPEKWCRPDYEIKDVAGLKQDLKKAIEGSGFKFPVDELVYNRGRVLDVMVDRIEQIIQDE